MDIINSKKIFLLKNTQEVAIVMLGVRLLMRFYRQSHKTKVKL